MKKATLGCRGNNRDTIRFTLQVALKLFYIFGETIIPFKLSGRMILLDVSVTNKLSTKHSAMCLAFMLASPCVTMATCLHNM